MDFLRILSDQREERDALPIDSYITRDRQGEIDLDSPLAQVVIGMRRAGKTTLCHQVLHAAQIPYAYINFDDETLVNLTASQLNDLLQTAFAVYGDFSHIFLDEIQNVDGWELFVNRLLRQGLHVILTGSNSNLLSQELGTHLTGRYHEIELLPLSFREFLAFRQLPPDAPKTTRMHGRLLNAYRDFAMNGGLPEGYLLRDRRNYLSTLYNAILFKDVVRRYNVKYPKILANLAAVLLENFCREINYSTIAKAFSLKGIHTLQKYTEYLEKAFLIRLLPKFSFKPLHRRQEEKAYAIDLGLVSSFSGTTDSGENAGWRMENLVFLKLYSDHLQQDFQLHYWKNGGEVDFVLTRHQRPFRLIQVAYDLSNTKTRQREINSLLKASAQLHCDDLHIVTLTERNTLNCDGKSIHIQPVAQFLTTP